MKSNSLFFAVGAVSLSLLGACSTTQNKDLSQVSFTAQKDETAIAPPQKHPKTTYFTVTKEEPANGPATEFPLTLRRIESRTSADGTTSEFPTVLHLHKINKEAPASVAVVRKPEPKRTTEPAPVDLGASSSGRSN